MMVVSVTMMVMSMTMMARSTMVFMVIAWLTIRVDIARIVIVI